MIVKILEDTVIPQKNISLPVRKGQIVDLPKADAEKLIKDKKAEVDDDAKAVEKKEAEIVKKRLSSAPEKKAK